MKGMEPKEMELEEKYMREAIRQAKKAGKLGEVPIGCVIVYQNKIIGRGYNPVSYTHLEAGCHTGRRLHFRTD